MTNPSRTYDPYGVIDDKRKILVTLWGGLRVVEEVGRWQSGPGTRWRHG